MMLIVACGAIRAIFRTSCGLSSLPSIFRMSLVLDLLLGTFMAMVIGPFSRPVIPSIFATSRAWPLVMWSMTVPSFIFETRSSVSLNCFSLRELVLRGSE